MAFTHNNGLTSSSPPSSTAEPDDISLLLSHYRPLQPPIPSSSPSALQPHSGIGMVNQHPVFICCSNSSSGNNTSTIFHHNSIPCPPSAIFSGSDRLVVDRISNAEPFGGDIIGFSNPGYFCPFGGGAGGGSGANSIGTMESESLTGSGDFGGQFRSLENETEDYDCESEEGAEAAMEELQPDQQQQQPQRSSSKRSRAAQVHNLSEKRRRSRINEKMKALQNLIPNSNKTDKASMLDEAIEYLKQLQLQVQMLSMRNGLSLHPMCLPGTMSGLLPIQLSQMGMDADNNACRDNNSNNTTLSTTMNIRTSSNNSTFPMNNPEEPSAVVDPNAMFNLLSITNPYAPLPPRPHTLNNTELVSFGPGSSSPYQGAHHHGPAPFDHLISSYQEISGRKDSCLPNRQLGLTRPESDPSGKERSSSQHGDMFTGEETLSMTLAMLRQNHGRNEFLPGATFDGL